MPIYDDQSAGPSRPSRFFGTNRPLYSIFGGRTVADILLWRNKNLSASILAGFTFIWFLFEVVELHFITVACYILMTLMLILFIWIQGADFFKWRPPSMNDIQISESTARHILSRVNMLLSKLYSISCGYDWPRFFMAIASLWIVSVVGSYTSALNFLYVVFLCLITIPVLYERYEREVIILPLKGEET